MNLIILYPIRYHTIIQFDSKIIGIFKPVILFYSYDILIIIEYFIQMLAVILF